MAKFIMKCPICTSEGKDVYVWVNSGVFGTGLFGNREGKCPNGHTFNINANKIAMKVCPHCGNNVAYDQSKGEAAVCPVCKSELNTLKDNLATVQIKCPHCGCTHSVAKDAKTIECAVCGALVDIQRELGKIQMAEENTVSCIKYEGNNETFVWKHPIEDFKFGSQLIVHDSQEALFFAGGQALDLFGGGTYTLTTENIPLLSAVYRVPSGEETFHSEVYFINKTVHTGIKWGTSSRISMFDPYSGMHVAIGASGQFNMAVSNSKKLILKLVGTTDVFDHSHSVEQMSESRQGDPSNNILSYIRSVVITKVKTHLANVIKEHRWSILELDAYLEELANGIKEKINLDLDEYGLFMPDFFILNISTPEDSTDPVERENYLRMKNQFGERYIQIREEENKEAVALAAQKRKLIEAETEARLNIIQSQGEAESFRLHGLAEADVQRAQGFTGKDKMQYDVQKAFAENIGGISGDGGGALGDLIGLGAGLGLMSKIGSSVSSMMDMPENHSEFLNKGAVVSTSDSWDCSCGARGQTGNFCAECGKPKPHSVNEWKCDCGAVNRGGNFCSECGKQRPVTETWTCSCGASGLSGKFCNVCGKKRDSEAIDVE